MALPKIGLHAVIENSAGFQKTLDTINKKMAETTQKTKDAAKSAAPFNQALDKMGASVDGLKAKFSQLTGISGGLVDGLFSIASALGPVGLAIGAAVAGAAALAAGFLALGNRGAPLIGLAESFDRLTASIGVSSQTLLKDLRAAANGTVADFDLIKRANFALVGATGEFGKQFGQNLPKLLQAARAAARATGQDVDFLFQSLVTGIKRASPLLIDNTGIVLKVGAANEALAQKLGKTVEQLTAEEKQIAVLNATLESGQRLIDSMGESQETNAEKLARSQAIITNTLDSLAVAVQPAFGTVLDLINRILSGFQALAVGLAPIISAIASIFTDVLGGAIGAVLDIVQPIIEAIASFLPYISIVFQGIASVISGVVNVIRNVIGGVVNFLKDVGQKLFGLDISNLGKNLFEGAAAAFGSFANGILAVANQLIFPAVIGIAKFIADFLIGFSPPKKGPLSMIDKGGENVMLAWLDGITGVSLDPVEQVAADVSAALGSVGKATLPLVEARLAQLDRALLPFQNRLDIVKSQFEAIAAPAQAALDAIERQTQAAMQALEAGDTTAAETIRRLDAARSAIQGQLDAQQGIVDRQQIQLSLAQASQAQERTLLNIRKAQLSVAGKAAAAVSAATGGALPKDKAGAGGAAPTPLPPTGATGGFALPTESVLDTISGQSAVDEALAGLQGAFMGEIDAGQMEAFAGNSLALQEQFDRIGSVDLGAKLGDKFKGLTDLFDASVEGSPANVISKFFSPDPATAGSLASFVNSLPDSINTIAHDVGERMGTALAGVFVFFTGEGEGTLKGILSVVTGDSSVEGSVANFFSLLPQRVSDAASGLFDKLKTDVFDPVSDFLTGEGPDTLSGIINSAVLWFEMLPQQIVYALQGIGASIFTSFALPVINVINSLIEGVENTLRGFLNGISNFVDGIAAGIDAANLGIDTSGLHNIVNDLKTKAGSISFGRISTALPSFLVPAAARGGLFGPGAINVGEHGPERIFAADKIGILPAELTRALDGLASMMASPVPMPMGGGDTNYNSSSSSFNFNGVQSDNDARRRFNALRAGML